MGNCSSMSDLNATRALRVSPFVKVSETQDGAVLLDVRQGLCFSMNPIGNLIWKHLSEGWEPAQITQQLADTFKISTEQASNDLQEFLRDLKQRQLVQELESTDLQVVRRGRLTKICVGLWRWVHNGRTNHAE